ncbi:hypothetical protein OOT00_16135, partial [Desulfobotulus sp. H1]|nr:hypothetical protein [Desulfobotulus pelophilus]
TMGNVLTRKDGLGRITRFDYDAKGRMVRMEDAAGLVTVYAYDAKDRRIREQSPSGLVTTFAYDGQDNLIHMERTAPGLDPEQSRFTYTPSGSILSQEDGEGKTIRYDYDAKGRLASTLDGRGNEIRQFYESGPDGSCSACSLTGRDLVSRIEYPTFEKEFRYDIRGRKTGERDILSDTEAL